MNQDINDLNKYIVEGTLRLISLLINLKFSDKCFILKNYAEIYESKKSGFLL